MKLIFFNQLFDHMVSWIRYQIWHQRFRSKFFLSDGKD